VRDAGGMREHVFPLLRLSDHATLSGARFELAGQCRDLRLEASRHLARLGLAPRRLRQPLVRERECEVIRDSTREVHVLFAEGIRQA
jgi:hypothetical protein